MMKRSPLRRPDSPRRRWRALDSVVLVGLVVAAGVVAAAPEDDVQRLEELVLKQQSIIERLERRVAELEAFRASVEGAAATPTVAVDALDVAILEEEVDGLRNSLGWLPDLTGYYDFVYTNDDRDDVPGSFDQHHVALIVAKDLGHFRFLSEVEFNHGAYFEAEDGEVEEARGEIEVERAWAEWSRWDLLRVRGGLILHPGYWNVNHYANVVLSTEAPLMVGEVFPKAFTGMMAAGRAFTPSVEVRYDLFVANDLQDRHEPRDQDEHKAVGGGLGLGLSVPGLDRFDVKLNAALDRGDGGDRVEMTGAELQLRRGAFEFLAEIARREGGGPERHGLYLQPSVSLGPRWATFYRYDWLDLEGGDEVKRHSLGLVYRPINDVSLKLEGRSTTVTDGTGTDRRSTGFSAAAALAF